MARKRIMITLSEKAIAELEEISKEKQMSKSIVIALAIEKMIKEEEEKRVKK